MVATLHYFGFLGAIEGQLVYSIGERITRGCTVFIPLGHKGPRADHKNKNSLGFDVGEHLNGY